jgi:hypothetical protein
MKMPIRVVSLLMVAVLCGCQKPNKNGEAFVVLKSSEVIYMADMQVLCFNSDFKKQFDSWKESYERDSQNLTSDVEAKNPMLRSNLTEIDNNIATLKLKAASVLQDTQTATSDLLLKLQSQRDALAAEQAKSSKASDEYIQITQPIDEKIKELETETNKICANQEALTSETFTKINNYIVDAQLTIPKIEAANEGELFTLESDRTYDYSFSPESRPWSSGFLAERKLRNDQSGSNGSDWIFLKNVSPQLEETQIAPAIKEAYQKWAELENSLEKITGQIEDENATNDQQLIPWENRYGISRWQAAELINRGKEIKDDLKQIANQLNIMKTGGKEASDLVQAAITARIAEINETVASLNEQRKNSVEEASETANAELKAQSRSKFYELLKNQTVTAVRTGSKGDFTIPGNTAYIYADAQRDNGEKLAWLVRVDPGIPTVKLSISNTASAGGDGEFDEFWMLKLNLE